MRSVLEKVQSGNRKWGVILAICMVVLGIILTIWPLHVSYALMVLATILFIVYGVYEIVVYIRTPKGFRNGWVLANGIMLIVLGAIILMGKPQSMYLTFAFLLGFMTLTAGISQISSFIALSGAPGRGWLLLSGILNIIMSFFFILSPFAATWAMAYVVGIYLIVGGIALFAEAASGQMAVRR